MQVKIYKELIECTKHNRWNGYGTISLSEFKEKYFTKEYLLESFIVLAAKSRLGGNISFADETATKEKTNSLYFFSNLDFLFDIDFKELRDVIRLTNLDDYPKEGDFYLFIEMWGKYKLFYIKPDDK